MAYSTNLSFPFLFSPGLNLVNITDQDYTIYIIVLPYSLIAAQEDTKVLIVATIAWGLRKCSRAIMLVLIFLIAMKPGIIHAVYCMFFLFLFP
jgi:hypothetical protein